MLIRFYVLSYAYVFSTIPFSMYNFYILGSGRVCLTPTHPTDHHAKTAASRSAVWLLPRFRHTAVTPQARSSLPTHAAGVAAVLFAELLVQPWLRQGVVRHATNTPLVTQSL